MKKKKKHNKIVMLARSKLNSIGSKIFEASIIMIAEGKKQALMMLLNAMKLFIKV